MSQQQQQSQPQPSPYGFMSYPAGVAAVGTAEYAFSPGGGPYPPPPPELAPSSSAGSVPPPPPPPPYLYAAAYAHHAHHHLGHHGHHGHHPPLPPSPIVTGAHLPPSPVLHHLQYQPHPHPPPHPPPHPHQNQQSTTTPPTSPDRYAETKAVRQLCTAVAKMQGTMRDLAERQEQILDRMSVLEQRSTPPPPANSLGEQLLIRETVGRVDDSIERILENTEIAMEDSKSIRNRVEDDERFPPRCPRS